MGGGNPTIAYYDQFGLDFAAATVAVEMGQLHERFLARLPRGGAILDAGCGSGRDSKAFLERGYLVTSIDGSQAMVEATTVLTGLPARRLRFEELDYVECFDGIWACASLLHLARKDLSEVLRRLAIALRTGGVIYMSFKNGDGDRVSRGRHFTDFTPDSLGDWLSGESELQILDIWETGDQRAERAEERWVNALLQKSSA